MCRLYNVLIRFLMCTPTALIKLTPLKNVILQLIIKYPQCVPESSQKDEIVAGFTAGKLKVALGHLRVLQQSSEKKRAGLNKLDDDDPHGHMLKYV